MLYNQNNIYREGIFPGDHTTDKFFLDTSSDPYNGALLLDQGPAKTISILRPIGEVPQKSKRATSLKRHVHKQRLIASLIAISVSPDVLAPIRVN